MNAKVTLISPDVLSQQARLHIDEWLRKYPQEQKKSAIIAALTYVQKENGGFLTNELIEAVAAYLEMPKIAAFEVATFYSMFELKPVGRHKICVCTNISCMLSGSDEIVKYLSNKLGINLGQTTADGKFTLKSVECLAACCGAPMMQIGDDYYENLNAQKIDEILASKE
ncbi:MAG: NADH-quinone oxidoreductase subunit NuoE [Proteobacteria bacterium]|nr:NADH-quinone oxidoreductase subunit NuoE [Pseudomonadota bacterium]